MSLRAQNGFAATDTTETDSTSTLPIELNQVNLTKFFAHQNHTYST